MGLRYNTPLLDGLWLYEFLQEENRKYNLTAIEGKREIITKHFLDSLVFTKYEPQPGEQDTGHGDGAGFTGLVMKLYQPELGVLLVDSLQKRINFLNLFN